MSTESQSPIPHKGDSQRNKPLANHQSQMRREGSLWLSTLAFLLVSCDGGSNPLPTPTPPPDPDPIIMNPECAKVMGVDGPGGFLWKPVAENNPNAVILLPSKFIVEFNKCHLNGEDLRHTGFSNGERQTLRASKPGKSYPAGSEIVCSDDFQLCTWRIKEHGSKRQD